MTLFYCRECVYHEIIHLREHQQSKCIKENCLSIYTKCLTNEAVKQFIDRDKPRIEERRDSALDICYERV